MHLITTPNIKHPDDFYQRLIDLHRGLKEEQSDALNAKLILFLANHIGDAQILNEAMARARAAITPVS